MKNKRLMVSLAVICFMSLLVFVACAPTVSSPDDSSSTASVDYSENSLIAFHETQNEDISNFSEASKENCGSLDCHGDWKTVQAETADVLEGGGKLANPHMNHMTKEIECYDCHNLTEASSLYCDSCHTWKLLKDNGTWETRVATE